MQTRSRLLVARLGAALVSVQLSAQVSAQAAPSASSYYPHATGQHWLYSNGELVVVGQPVRYKGVDVVPTNHQFGKALVSQELLEYRADGSVWLRGVNVGGKLSWYAQPLNVYPPGPLRVGQSWAIGRGTSRVVGTGAVKNEAGTFNALIVSTEYPGSRPQWAYFVPSLGVVRFQTADGVIRELVKAR